MNPVNQYKFYELGAKLYQVIARTGATPAAEMFVPLMEAQAALDTLIKGDPIPLDFAKSEATALLNRMGAVFNRHFIDGASRQFRFPAREETIDPHEIVLLRSLTEKFETALAAELSRRAIYAVPRRGLFDARDLAEQADLQFSETTLAAIPEGVRAEIRAAGCALAFGLGNAACFHLLRAVETALSYYLSRKGRGGAAGGDALWQEASGLLAPSGKINAAMPEGRLAAMLHDMDARYRAPLSRAGQNFSVQEALLFFSAASGLLELLMEEAARATAPVPPRSRAKEVAETLEQLSLEESAAGTESVENRPA